MRAVLASLSLSLAVAAGSCGPAGPRYSADPQRYKGLPTEPNALVSLADQLHGVAPHESTLRQIDRGFAALELALEKRGGTDVEVLWRLARATFLMTEHLKNREQRLSYATRGQDYAERALRGDGPRVEPHYYLALNLAKIAEAANKVGLIKRVMEVAKKAEAIDPRFDDAGPLRLMGKVYITAPAWPVSVGSSEEGVKTLERAVALAPVPLNRLFLGEAYFHDEEYGKAKEQLLQALKEGQRLDPRWRREAESYLRRAGSKS
jgi:tetratricopeptide (TPR) repeat protein